VAVALLITVGGVPDRMRSESRFAARCDVSPIPASSVNPTATDSTAEATGRPTPPFTTSPSPASADTRTEDYAANEPPKG